MFLRKEDSSPQHKSNSVITSDYCNLLSSCVCSHCTKSYRNAPYQKGIHRNLCDSRKVLIFDSVPAEEIARMVLSMKNVRRLLPEWALEDGNFWFHIGNVLRLNFLDQGIREGYRAAFEYADESFEESEEISLYNVIKYLDMLKLAIVTNLSAGRSIYINPENCLINNGCHHNSCCCFYNCRKRFPVIGHGQLNFMPCTFCRGYGIPSSRRYSSFKSHPRDVSINCKEFHTSYSPIKSSSPSCTVTNDTVKVSSVTNSHSEIHNSDNYDQVLSTSSETCVVQNPDCLDSQFSRTKYGSSEIISEDSVGKIKRIILASRKKTKLPTNSPINDQVAKRRRKSIHPSGYRLDNKSSFEEVDKFRIDYVQNDSMDIVDDHVVPQNLDVLEFPTTDGNGDSSASLAGNNSTHENNVPDYKESSVDCTPTIQKSHGDPYFRFSIYDESTRKLLESVIDRILNDKQDCSENGLSDQSSPSTYRLGLKSVIWDTLIDRLSSSAHRSGLKGVVWNSFRRVWEASWKGPNGKRFWSSFRADKLGFEQAKRQAVVCRLLSSRDPVDKAIVNLALRECSEDVGSTEALISSTKLTGKLNVRRRGKPKKLDSLVNDEVFSSASGAKNSFGIQSSKGGFLCNESSYDRLIENTFNCGEYLDSEILNNPDIPGDAIESLILSNLEVSDAAQDKFSDYPTSSNVKTESCPVTDSVEENRNYGCNGDSDSNEYIDNIVEHSKSEKHEGVLFTKDCAVPSHSITSIEKSTSAGDSAINLCSAGDIINVSLPIKSVDCISSKSCGNLNSIEDLQEYRESELNSTIIGALKSVNYGLSGQLCDPSANFIHLRDCSLSSKDVSSILQCSESS